MNLKIALLSLLFFLGGAGGKGTWGKPGSELYAEAECHDTHDPNYDSDQQVRKHP